MFNSIFCVAEHLILWCSRCSRDFQLNACRELYQYPLPLKPPNLWQVTLNTFLVENFLMRSIPVFSGLFSCNPRSILRWTKSLLYPDQRRHLIDMIGCCLICFVWLVITDSKDKSMPNVGHLDTLIAVTSFKYVTPVSVQCLVLSEAKCCLTLQLNILWKLYCSDLILGLVQFNLVFLWSHIRKLHYYFCPRLYCNKKRFILALSPDFNRFIYCSWSNLQLDTINWPILNISKREMTLDFKRLLRKFQMSVWLVKNNLSCPGESYGWW